jgi:hypothetical protein
VHAEVLPVDFLGYAYLLDLIEKPLPSYDTLRLGTVVKVTDLP